MLPNDDHSLFIAAAREAGYNDAVYDGLYLPGYLPCHCLLCHMAYDEEFQKGKPTNEQK